VTPTHGQTAPSVTAQIVAAEKFLLEELILLCGEWAWQASRR
jgi:hypothetical protein